MPNTPTKFMPEIGFTRLPEFIDELFRENFMFPRRLAHLYPTKHLSNLLETDEKYIVQLMLYGIDPEKLTINVVGNQLTVKVLCEVPVFEHAAYLWHGLYGDEFSEVFTLPFEVDGDKAE